MADQKAESQPEPPTFAKRKPKNLRKRDEPSIVESGEQEGRSSVVIQKKARSSAALEASVWGILIVSHCYWSSRRRQAAAKTKDHSDLPQVEQQPDWEARISVPQQLWKLMIHLELIKSLPVAFHLASYYR